MHYALALNLFFAAFLMAFPAPGQVTVHMGFMDEEMQPVPQWIIEQARREGRPVVIVERASSVRFCPGSSTEICELYQRPIGSYTIDKPVLAGSGDDFGSRLSRGLQSKLPELKREIEKLADPGMELKAGRNAEMVVMTFNGSATGKPLVLLRSPEMGLQQEAMKAYVGSIYSSIRQMPEAAREMGGITTYSFGAGGAVGNDVRPGAIRDIRGTIFIGVESVGNEKYRPVIYGSDYLGRKIYFYKGEEATRKIAESSIRAYVTQNKIQHLRSLDNSRENLLRFVQSVKHRTLGDVSLTVSFFADKEIKDAVRPLGVSVVAMEDTLLEVIQQESDHTRLYRVAWDPPDIPDVISQRVTRYAQTATLHASDYEDAILWSLRGLPPDNIPASLHWNATFAQIPANQLTLGGKPVRLDEIIYHHVLPDRRQVILNPFLSEVATDFLLDVERGRALTFEILDPSIKNSLSPEVAAFLKILIEEKANELKKIATQIKTMNPSTQEALIRQEVRKLLAAMNDLDVEKMLRNPPSQWHLKWIRALKGSSTLNYGQLLAKVRSELSVASKTAKGAFISPMRIRLLGATAQPFNNGTSRFSVWIRKGKWEKNVVETLDQLARGADALPGAMVDRSLYIVGLKSGQANATAGYFENVRAEHPRAIARIQRGIEYSRQRAIETEKHAAACSLQERLQLEVEVLSILGE